jgi:hypothetical protein
LVRISVVEFESMFCTCVRSFLPSIIFYTYMHSSVAYSCTSTYIHIQELYFTHRYKTYRTGIVFHAWEQNFICWDFKQNCSLFCFKCLNVCTKLWVARHTYWVEIERRLFVSHDTILFARHRICVSYKQALRVYMYVQSTLPGQVTRIIST